MGARYLVVGRNSFLAGRFQALGETEGDCDFVTHQEAAELGPGDLRLAQCIVNFALDPAYRSGRYSEERDFDRMLADKLSGGSGHYIMLSSRAVYARDGAMGAKETDPVSGNETPYGQNKLETEQRLTEKLRDRLTILRVANVIGNEYGSGRRTFMSQALERLKSKNEILLDISPDVRRDFLPDTHFVKVMDAVLRHPYGGPLNVGSGLPTRVGDIAAWIMEGYGAGRVVVSDRRVHDEFCLDVTRLNSTYGIRCTGDEIAKHCREIGRQLR